MILVLLAGVFNAIRRIDLATGGVSLLGQAAVAGATEALDKTDYCTPALAGKKVVPGEKEKAEAAEPATTSEPSKTEAVQDKVKSLGEGLGSGLKGLFGN